METWARASMPFVVVNGLLAGLGGLFSFIVSWMFLSISIRASALGVAAIGIMGAILFYQCFRSSRGDATFLDGKTLFLLAALIQFMACGALLLWAIYLLLLNLHDPRDWHGDEVDLSGFAMLIAAFGLWPATGGFICGIAYIKERKALSIGAKSVG